MSLGRLQERLLSQSELWQEDNITLLCLSCEFEVMSNISQPSSLSPFHGDSMMNKDFSVTNCSTTWNHKCDLKGKSGSMVRFASSWQEKVFFLCLFGILKFSWSREHLRAFSIIKKNSLSAKKKKLDNYECMEGRIWNGRIKREEGEVRWMREGIQGEIDGWYGKPLQWKLPKTYTYVKLISMQLWYNGGGRVLIVHHLFVLDYM